MNPYLLNVIELGPITMERIIERIDPRRYDEHLTDDRFSVREIMAHLADWEPIMRGRIQQAVEAPGTEIVAYDESQRAFEQNYISWNVSESVGTFKKERAQTARFLQTVSQVSYSNLVQHPERGTLTAYDLMNMLNGHDLYHIEQLTQYLAEKTSPTW